MELEREEIMKGAKNVVEFQQKFMKGWDGWYDRGGNAEHCYYHEHGNCSSPMLRTYRMKGQNIIVLCESCFREHHMSMEMAREFGKIFNLPDEDC